MGESSHSDVEETPSPEEQFSDPGGPVEWPILAQPLAGSQPVGIHELSEPLCHLGKPETGCRSIAESRPATD